MGILSGEWEDRLAHWLRTLKMDFYEELGEISWRAFRTKEQLRPEDLEEERMVPAGPGFTWGKAGSTAGFAGRLSCRGGRLEKGLC